MSDPFHYDPAGYHEQVEKIAEHVISNGNALPTIAPRANFESNSYHGAAIRKADQDRLNKPYPRLHR